MIFDTNNEKILEIFLKNPTQGFQVRGIIRTIKLGNPTVLRVLKHLSERGLIKKVRSKVYPYYTANLDNPLFRKIKLLNSLIHLEKLVGDISNKVRPNCIILFGSASKGADTENSDIDIFVQSKRHEFDAENVSKKLNRKINLLFEPEIKKLSSELLNNLANGIVLYGFFEVIK